jgi:large subunit ribosomal protein L9
MEVILLQDVARLGRAGDVCKVTPGFARNHLIPKGLAVLATEGALSQLQQRRKAEARREKELETEARELAGKLEGVIVTISAKSGEKDRLYGSVTTGDIAQALKEKTGTEVDRRKIELEEPIRQLGIYTVPIRLLSDLSPSIRVDVVGQDEETTSEQAADEED